MGTKQQPGEFDCYGAALPDEPLFTLLGRDRLAPGLVRAWADEREDAVARGEAPESDREKIAEARACAARMEAWREKNNGAWREKNPELPLADGFKPRLFPSDFTLYPNTPRFLDDVPGAAHALAHDDPTPCQTGEPCIGGDCRCA